jgi:hypothetical protein
VSAGRAGLAVPGLDVRAQVGHCGARAVREENRLRCRGRLARSLVAAAVELERLAQLRQQIGLVAQRRHHVVDVHQPECAADRGLTHAQQREEVGTGQRTLRAICVQVAAVAGAGVPSGAPLADMCAAVRHPTYHRAAGVLRHDPAEQPGQAQAGCGERFLAVVRRTA